MNYHLKLWVGVLAFAAVAAAHAAAQGQRPTMPRAGVGPADRPVVDPEAADRGRRVWVSECITCHGAQARGTDTGPNLLRSLVVLRDRYGSELGPFLKKGHPMQSGKPSASLTDAQIMDLSHFLRQRIEDTLRGRPLFTVQERRDRRRRSRGGVLQWRRQVRHRAISTTGDLAGIASQAPRPSTCSSGCCSLAGGRRPTRRRCRRALASDGHGDTDAAGGTADLRRARRAWTTSRHASGRDRACRARSGERPA